jgi:hypothetical protein
VYWSKHNMAGYIGSKSSVTLVDGYTEAEADAEFVNDPNGAITVSGSNVGIGTSSPSADLDIKRTAGDNNDILRVGSTDNYYHGFARSNTTGALSIQGNQTNFNNILLAPTSGNVGINTSSPTEKLQVESGVNSFPATSGSTQTGAALRLRGADNAVLDMGLNSVNTWIQATDKTALNSNYTLCLNPNGGGLLVGTTTTQSSYRMNIAPHSNGGFIAYRAASTANHYPATFINSSGSGVGNIVITTTSTSYNTSSDYRLKENVVDLTGASARVNQLNPSRFNWIADETNTLVDGFLAHEVATVVPEAIHGTKDAMKDEEYEVTPAVLDDDGNVTTEAVMGTRSVPDYQGIDQSKLVPLLTAALQEALTEIASLKTRVEALEA